MVVAACFLLTPEPTVGSSRAPMIRDLGVEAKSARAARYVPTCKRQKVFQSVSVHTRFLFKVFKSPPEAVPIDSNVSLNME